ncbi:MAG: prepilin peptidase [Candidatus Eremiobacter antarcticus]|nr:prepilin peptidase [Candidatus Eremiobacteraeota bacterium]MBC5808896.1 prepilin peptidase [Candidatus Eremiobacteraeota bacterium]PZR60419.1 MAG: prepilin peptidase [Candidatus Eremiobacter sp. RRmetagenome_bin22]
MSLETLLLTSCAAILGAAIGSFLNVVIHRTPRSESIAYPGSRCTACGHSLSWSDNIPVLSWLALRGRCRYCKAPISARYMVVELMTAAVFALAVLEFGAGLAGVRAALLGTFLIATMFIDIDHLLILDSITIPVAAAGLLLSIALHQALSALEGAFLGAALFGAVYLISRGRGLGLGDVKLAACLGIFLGLANGITAFAASFVIGALLALPVLALSSRGRKDVLPFGPFLVLAALIVTFSPVLVFGPYQAYQSFVSRHLGM